MSSHLSNKNPILNSFLRSFLVKSLIVLNLKNVAARHCFHNTWPRRRAKIEWGFGAGGIGLPRNFWLSSARVGSSATKSQKREAISLAQYNSNPLLPMHNRLIPIIDATSLDKYICILNLSSKRKCTASCMTDYINGVKLVSTKLNKLRLSCAKLSLALASYLLVWFWIWHEKAWKNRRRN